ncbi:MAG: pyridoxamine 5'-phosphate oxidase family protein [Myxococcota bacterium]
MEWNIEDPSTLREQIWAKLLRAKADRRSPWRTPVVATVGTEGPSARTVVLREVEPNALCFHTDARSEKINELGSNQRVTWVFWDPKGNVQLRARTVATLHRDDDVAARAWSAQGPGAQALFDLPGQPGAPLGDLTPAERPFVWVRCEVRSLDWLWLTRPEHVRVRWRGNRGARVVP